MTLLDRIRPSRARDVEHQRLPNHGNSAGTRQWSGTRILGRRTHTIRLIFTAIACVSLLFTFFGGPNRYPRYAISVGQAVTEPQVVVDPSAVGTEAIDQDFVDKAAVDSVAANKEAGDKLGSEKSASDKPVEDGKDDSGEEKKGGYRWQHFRRLTSYFNGVRTLTPVLLWEPENRYDTGAPPPEELTPAQIADLPRFPPILPLRFDPYPDYRSPEYLADHHPVETCFLDPEEKRTPAPHVHAFFGLPRNAADPFYGSYSELGMRDDVCWDRIGRLASYGFGYNSSADAAGPGMNSEREGDVDVFKMIGQVDYSRMNWGAAQKSCNDLNAPRFDRRQPPDKKRVPKQAFVLRTWTGRPYGPAQLLSLRAMISELVLKSGGEFDVHFLVHVKNNSLPIWADADLYRRTLEENVPREFWGISTLWSEQQMRTYYPSPFGDNFANMVESNLHGAYRSPHFALQWFSQEHPEYDFIWNWEMDVRYSGHYYDFASKIGEWAAKQPRKGLWERNKRFWVPEYHGDFQNFTKFVEEEIENLDGPVNDPRLNGPLPVWGPVRDFTSGEMLPVLPENMPPRTYEEDNYEWGVGEEADLITFNPIFDPSETNWVFRKDVTGYPLEENLPPRRAAIITIGRLSKRLLNTMHEETWKLRHTMFPEMWAATMSLHHGYKAVYAPHPVFFDHDWDLEYMVQQLNRPTEYWQSPFGWGENNLLGSTFYYNSGFAATLWRRWLGQVENGEGGRRHEQENTGRMCLRPMLHHPVKHENGLDDLPVEDPEEPKVVEDVVAKANEEAKVKDAAVEEAKEKAKEHEAALEEAKLKEAALEEARLKEVALAQAKLKEAAVEEKAKEAGVQDARLEEAAIEAAKLKEAAIAEATLKEAMEATIKDAKTKEAAEVPQDKPDPPPTIPKDGQQAAKPAADANDVPAPTAPKPGEAGQVVGPIAKAKDSPRVEKPVPEAEKGTGVVSGKAMELPPPPNTRPKKRPKPLNL